MSHFAFLDEVAELVCIALIPDPGLLRDDDLTCADEFEVFVGFQLGRSMRMAGDFYI